MAEITVETPDSLIDRLFPPTWKQIALAAVVMLALIALVVTLENAWSLFWGEGLWSNMLIAPGVIIYILIIGRLMVPFQQRSIASLRSISALDEQSYQQLLQQTRARTSRGATPALLAGFLVIFLGSLPTLLSEPFNWINLYFILLPGLMFGMLALVVQQSLAEGWLSNQLLKGPLDFDIFYTVPFLPIGLQSLVSALAFIGGSTIAILLTAAGRYALSWADAVIHGILIIVTLLVFFLPMRQAHKVLRSAKISEQNNIRRELAAAYRRLEVMTPAEKEDIIKFTQEVNLWNGFEQRLKEVPTWPYNAGMLRTLFVSILLPIAVTVGQRVMAYVLVELGIQ